MDQTTEYTCFLEDIHEQAFIQPFDFFWKVDWRWYGYCNQATKSPAPSESSMGPAT